MRLKAILAFGCASVVATAALGSPATPSNQLTIHEWGTFTALQDENGNAVRGINTDDEPVPGFVHNLHGMLIQTPTQVPPVYFKGAPRSESDVYVRLETPVIYFYPPAGAKPHTVDVDVSFKGGWLTQFYPNAKASAPGLEDGRFEFGTLTDNTVGSLAWHNVQVGVSDAQGPQTNDPVWTAPRQVQAAMLRAEGGESERYLFYRGVGHINAPIRVVRGDNCEELSIRSQFGTFAHLPKGFSTGPLWLVDVRPNGSCAMRTIDHVDLSQGPEKTAATIPATFSASDYAADLKPLRKSMHAALVDNGLFDDEAEALLNTWEVSYFKRPGLRLFFMVPQMWADHYLPLKVSESADIRRVFVGRIEIVTPQQRQLLRRIAAGPASDSQWVYKALEAAGGNREDFYREDWYKRVMDGKQDLTSLHITMPEDYKAYLALGRFRNALILDEAAHRPTPALREFIRNYDLEASRTKGT